MTGDFLLSYNLHILCPFIFFPQFHSSFITIGKKVHSNKT